MTDRDNPGGGGLTGATGDLTPESPDQAFEPGERRAVEGPERGQGTSHSPAGSDGGEGPDTPIGGDELSDREERF